MTHTNDDFFKVFGEISVHFATLDFLTTALILRLVRIERIKKKGPIDDRVRLDRMTLGQKFRFLEKLQDDQVYDQGVLKDLRQILQHAIELSEERNRYIHDQWEFAGNTIAKGKIRRATMTNLDKWLQAEEIKKFTLADLEGFRGDIDDMQHKIDALVGRLRMENQFKNAMQFLKSQAKEE